jgi:hypothetical protein
MTETNNTSNVNTTASLSNKECDAPFLYVSDDFLITSWRVMYWTMFLLTVLLLPIMQRYCDSVSFRICTLTITQAVSDPFL